MASDQRVVTLRGGLPALPARQRGGNNAKPWIKGQFNQEGLCSHCPPGSKAHALNNTTVLKNHLLNVKVCPFLTSTVAKQLAGTVSEVRVARLAAGITDDVVAATSTGKTAADTTRQAPIIKAFGGAILTAGDNRMLQRKMAEMVYQTNLPHSWVEHPAVIDFFKLLRPAFIPPSRFQASASTWHEKQVSKRATKSAGGERNWSTWANVWSDTRSSMLVGRVCMLVYVHYNMRVLNRKPMPQPTPDLDWLLFLRDLSEQREAEEETASSSSEEGEEEVEGVDG